MKDQPDGAQSAEHASWSEASCTRRSLVSGLAAAALALPVAGRMGAADASARESIADRMLARGTAAYEAARRKGVWQTSTPDRYPDFIFQARSAAAVADVLRYARSRNLTVAVKGSGHNYTSTYLRNGGILLDLSQLRQVSLDPTSLDVTVEPGITNGELASFLERRNRAFPTGHHGGVGLGGYLLGGGMGWNGETWGQFACFSIKAVEVVTADGKAIMADASTDPDLYWAARGAGPFFCAAATRFRLQSYPAPRQILSSQYTYPLASAGELARWLQRAADERTANLDLFLLLLTQNAATSTTRQLQIALVYALYYDEASAGSDSALQRLSRGAPPGEVADRHESVPVTFTDLYAESLTGPARRTGADTAWATDSVRVTELLARQFALVPSPATVGIINYRSAPKLPDTAACTMAGSCFVQWLGQWDEPAGDAENLAWVQRTAALLAPHSHGAYVNESDILRRPERVRMCYSPAALHRLRAVRAKYDPHDLLPAPVPL